MPHGSFMGDLIKTLSSGAHIAAAGAQAGTQIAGTFFGSIMKALSTTLNVLQMGGGLVISLAGRLTGIIGTVLRIAVGAAASVIGVGMAGALKAQLEASGVLQMAQQSGRSVGSSIIANSMLGGFGVKAGDVSGLQDDVFRQRMMGDVWGVGDTGTPEGLAQYRQRFQGMYNSGPMGRMMAGSMESSMGLQGLRGTALLPDDLFNKQQQRSGAIQNSLGMNPQDVQRAAQNFTLLKSSIAQLGGTVLTRIGTEVLPYIIKVTDKAIDAVIRNGDRLAKGIHDGVGAGVRALATFGIFLVRDFPDMVFSGAKLMLRGVAAVAEVGPMLGETIMNIGDIAKSAIGSIWQSMQELWGMLQGKFNDFMKTPMGQMLTGGASGGLPNGIPGVPENSLVNKGLGVVSAVRDATKGAARWITKTVGGSDTEAEVVAQGTDYLLPALGLGALGLAKKGLRAGMGRLLFPTASTLSFPGVPSAGSWLPGMGPGSSAIGRTIPSLLTHPYGLAALAGTAVIGGGLWYRNKREHDALQAENDRVGGTLAKNNLMNPGRARREYLLGRGAHPGFRRTPQDVLSDMGATGRDVFSAIGGQFAGLFQAGDKAMHGQYSGAPNQFREMALQAIANIEKTQSQYKPDDMVKLLQELNAMTKEGVKQSTKIADNSNKLPSVLNGQMNSVIGYYAQAQNETTYLNLIR